MGYLAPCVAWCYALSMMGEELVAARGKLGLTATDLASAFGVHVTTIWRWETGKQPIPRWVALAIEALSQRRPSQRGGNAEGEG